MELEAVLGVDFGTSSTKVVIQLPHLPGGLSVAVPFEGAPEAFPYLLPTILWRNSIGTLSLEPRSEFAAVSGLKQRFIEERGLELLTQGRPVSYSGEDVAAAFLGLVIKHAKQWFVSSQQKIVGSSNLYWSLNLGMQAANFTDQTLRDRYLRLARKAWALAGSSSISVRHASRVAPDEEAEIEVVPDVVAAAIGYARSPNMRSDGLHLLVDVGASTLDLCGFVLHRNQAGDRYSMLVAEVEPLGALSLHRARTSSLEAGVVDPANRAWQDMLLTPVPQHVNGYIEGISLDSLRRTVRAADESFEADVALTMRRAVHALRLSLDMHSDRWRTSLPVFLCGGAGEAKFYSYRIAHEIRRYAERTWRGSVEVQPIPVPRNLRAPGLGASQFGRLAIAWGLSHPRLDIGEVKTPLELGVTEPRPVRAPVEAIDKEMV